MKDYLQTVTGPVAREDMGLTLPHEHLFNDLSSVVDAPCYPFSQQLVDKKVTAEIQWALKHDPYCCADNMDRKPIEDVIFEINNFISLGGRTIVDATGSESIGRDAQALREVALKTGLNIVASSGPYLEKFESQRIHKTVDELATTIDKELNQGIGDTDIRAGMIGEIGVSPTFTEAGYHSCVRCCRYIRETQVNPQCRQAGMNIQCVPHRLTNTLLPEGVVFVGHG